MRLKDAIKTASFKKSTLKQAYQLYTKWGETIDPERVLNEYPRPQLKRNNYVILNGYWNYSITKSMDKPKEFEGRILVPFSPESALSGVNRQLKPEEYLWYERILPIEKKEDEKRCLLHFGAVDQYCEIFINEKKAGEHMGGYLPFSFDITDKITEGDNLLTLKVTDSSDTSYHSRGKQKLDSGGMFYTAQSGIWQTVWMEWVPRQYIDTVKITPSVDKKQVVFTVTMKDNEKEESNPKFKVKIFEGKKVIQSLNSSRRSITVPIQEPTLWSPENPFLYNVVIITKYDRVTSYFAMRKFEIKKDAEGLPRIFLNDMPYFQNGLLDQGYWPDGLYTAPSDQAMIFDIQGAKDLGFNMLRKHIKIEPLRWYYHCDRLGMIVWQDMVNGGSKYNMVVMGYLPTIFPHLIDRVKDNRYRLFSREYKEGREEWIEECKETVNLLYNCPSVAVWVPFNESWGQFDANKMVKVIHKIDKTRLVDHASGWYDQKGGDFRSIHNYLRTIEVVPEKRAFVLSEFGGYACHIPKHSYSDQVYGYRMFSSRKELDAALKELYENEILPSIKKGLAAAVLTQVADVEDEVNGLYTYDRKVCKVKKIEVPYRIE